MNMRKLTGSTLALAGVMTMGMGVAHADLLISPTGGTVSGPVAGVYTYSYAVNLAEPETLEAGDYFTIYDFNGLVANTETTPSAFWTYTVQPTGTTPSLENPPDSALFPNVTFTYSGPTVTTPPTTPVGTFTIQSTVAPVTLGGYYSGSLGGGNDQFLHKLTTPAGVPEPSTVVAFAFTGIGALGMMLRARKSRGNMAA